MAVLVASGAGWWMVGRADESIAERSVDALVPDDPSIRSGIADGASAGDAAAENILILGLDTRPADDVRRARAPPSRTSP